MSKRVLLSLNKDTEDILSGEAKKRGQALLAFIYSILGDKVGELSSKKPVTYDELS